MFAFATSFPRNARHYGLPLFRRNCKFLNALFLIHDSVGAEHALNRPRTTLSIGSFHGRPS